MIRLVGGIVLALLGLAIEAAAQEPAKAFPQSVQPLFAAHCVSCHGPDAQEGGLRLDTLAWQADDARVRAQWTRVHDKIAAGEMPPADSPQPPKDQLAAAMSTLRERLHAASLAEQQQRGRVVLRRLNGTEYENTIRDLLATNVKVKELLPDDNSASGFDNVGTALDLSATHLLLYQEAAERAILSTIPTHPIIPFSDRLTGKEISTKGPNFKQTLTRSCRLEGDGLIIYSKLPRYGLCATAHVQADGRYRVKMSVGAVGEDQKPVPAAFMTVERSGREDAVVRELRDIAPGPPRVVEVEIDLKRGQAFVINLLTNWDIRAFKKPIEEYNGPGVLVEWLSIEGPIDTWPPESYERLFSGVPLQARSVAKALQDGKKPPPVPANRTVQNWLFDPLMPVSEQPQVDAERLIRAFLPRAFRRPVSEELQQHFIGLVQAKLAEKYSFLDAMIYGYKAILTSPHFLLLIEPNGSTVAVKDQPAAGSPRLNDYALASRLSYFLWSTMPDAELLRLAAAGELHQPEVLKAQVERMLGDARSERFTQNFVGQWLDLRKIDATIPDPHLYGDFDGTLLWAMPRETRLFFEEVLDNNLSLLEFVDSDWSMLNERLAKHYGIPGIVGNDFRKVKLPPGSHRGGVMTQASVLKVTADGTTTSPVLRGKWVLERIIGKPPAPPPANVPAIEPDIRGATTIRQQLDKHRNIAVCASCHKQIDPPGFALESFDPIGGYRDFYRASARTTAGIVMLPNYTGRPFYRGPDVEKGGVTPEGHDFADIDDYKRLLLTDKDQIARSLAQQLLVYATGAEIEFADREAVEQIVSQLRQQNYGFRTLVHQVVQSRLFVNK